ncbi:hypothetical protein TcCL_Unassigned02104 [Trypanosoma cruzi]|uniref:Uncharacterized protein n=1 Tax=Trypanosoma cruzi (strain CL Brener) TaxID=353153 RepID=Q4CU20_TRYCC|nr:hypothetical protein Tc00.1047053510545.20 [Trypanosoma cruzi]EAN83771.1 hypothetical protein Tc00.1047053510545.20 [Trypanosoma cruzi]RNC35045.1 hypothetical protein TcCL_Unassigned02104 [Trypanosoma cruzi]|eukprot:XP_805622.1 hypothetical protein [Trypanosoma cruzi strain CL Brener]
MRLPPTLRKACTRPANHKQLPVSVVPSLLTEETGSPLSPPEHLHDVSAATPCRKASGGLMSCPIFGRVRSSVHNMEGTRSTCSAWRSDSWRSPRVRMSQWLHRLFNRRLKNTSPPKMSSLSTSKKRTTHLCKLQ